MSRLIAAATLIVAGLCALTSADARGNSLLSGPGSLDPAFGNGGKAIVASALAPVAARVQPDGKIVLMGNNGPAPGLVQIVRLLSNGVVDGHFGNHGVVSLSMSTAKALTLLADGRILIGGGDTSGSHAELVRLRTDGTLDASFGSQGIVLFDYVANSSNAAFVIIEEPDGKLIVGGFGLAVSSDDYLTSVARLQPNGSFDTSFGSNGVSTVDAVGGVTAMGLQSDGKILVCGGFITAAPTLVMRFLHDGEVDKDDAGGTLARVAHAGSLTLGTTNAFQLDGKLVQWHSIAGRNGNRVQIVRLLRNYTPDPQFKSRPFAFGSPSFSLASDVEIASDGKLFVGGGAATTHGRAVFGLARLLPRGAQDDDFGPGGRVLTAFSHAATATALAVGPDGKLVSAGVNAHGSSTELVIARYLTR